MIEGEQVYRHQEQVYRHQEQVYRHQEQEKVINFVSVVDPDQLYETDPVDPGGTYKPSKIIRLSYYFKK